MNTTLFLGLVVCACVAYATALPVEEDSPVLLVQEEQAEQDLQPEESHHGWRGGWGHRGYGYGGYGYRGGYGYGRPWGHGHRGWNHGYGGYGGWGWGY